MKKMIMAVAIVCAATFAQAATVGWTNAGLTNYAGNLYNLFVVGQNGVESVAAITALLNDGADISTYAFASGNVASNGAATTLAGASGKTLGVGTYESFFVLFDKSTSSAAENYLIVSGMPNQTKEVTGSTASITFSTGNLSQVAGNSSNWSAYGAVPEPTSGLLLLLGMAGLALKRKVA